MDDVQETLGELLDLGRDRTGLVVLTRAVEVEDRELTGKVVLEPIGKLAIGFKSKSAITRENFFFREFF